MNWQSTYHLLARFVTPYRRPLVFVAATAIVVGFMMSVRPLLIAPALDVFVNTGAKPASGLRELSLNNIGPTMLSVLHLNQDNLFTVGVTVAILFVGFTVLIASLSLISQSVLIRTRTDLLRDIITTAHERLVRLSLSYFNNAKTGDLVSRLATDSGRTATIVEYVVGLLRYGGEILITLLVLVHADPLLVVALLVLGPLHLLVTKYLSSKVRRRAKATAEQLGTMSATLTDTVSGARLIKAFTAEKHDAKRVRKVAEELRERRRSLSLANYYQVPFRLLIDSVVVALLLMIVIYAVSEERLTLTAAGLFVILAQRLSTPVGEFFSNVLAIQNVLGSASRISHLFEQQQDITTGSIGASHLRNRIILQNVSFDYDDGKKLLSKIDLTINKGDTIALVGPSGAGKTTFTDLVLHFYDPTEGTIQYDGIDIREFTENSYRRQFGLVPQEDLIFQGSVFENIVFHNSVESDRLTHAIWTANAQTFIDELPQKIDTIVGDRGVKLSGGQRQRIAIARAIYHQPSVLILDEATSALDAESEKAVQEAIRRVSTEVTTIIIAHRLSTITNAHKIVVLNRGQIEAVGTHADLVEKSITYRRLYELQTDTPRMHKTNV